VTDERAHERFDAFILDQRHLRPERVLQSWVSGAAASDTEVKSDRYG